MFSVIDKLNDKQVDELMSLYQQTWWGNERRKVDVEVMLQKSVIIGILNSENILVGFARILTDGIYKALILDVIVDEGYRGKKIGKMIFDTIVSHPLISQVKHLELYCKEEMIPFYKKWGFGDAFTDLVFMRKVN